MFNVLTFAAHHHQHGLAYWLTLLEKFARIHHLPPWRPGH